MSQKVTSNWWTLERARAAESLATGDKTDQQVADEVGVTRRQLARWKNVPTFRQRIAEITQTILDTVRAEGILHKQNRLLNLHDRVQRMTALMAAREAEFRQTGETAGGETGLLVRDYKGKNADRIVYRFDAALLRELREHEKQAAQELGQWAEKHEIGGPGGGPVRIIVEYESSDDDQD